MTKPEEHPQLDVIAVGAHPDDVEIACGGTLALLAKQGYRVGIIDLTDGEPTPLSPGPAVRLAEAERAAKILGVTKRIQLDMTNRRLFDSFEARVALGIEFRKYRPKLVLGFGEKTPLASPDHWQAMQITDAAVFYSRLCKWDDYFGGLPVHTISAHLYYTLAFGALGLPPAGGHLVVDITDTLDKKLEAIRCYETQFPPAKGHVLDRVRAFAMQQGQAAGYYAGELLASPRTLGTRDLMHFLFGMKPGDEPRKPDMREMVPKFIYFDLGNVLLYFDHALSCRQMAAAAGITEAHVREAVFDSGLQWQYEEGRVTSQQFYEEFCRRTDRRPAYDALAFAAGAIFRMNESMRPVLAHLKECGFRLGLLSNTCEMHWDYFASGRYSMIPDFFDVVTLSFRVGAMKPDPKIYAAAAAAAHVRPDEIFFMDDTAGHVAAARACGYDAVQYTDTPTLVKDLRKRGVQFNY